MNIKNHHTPSEVKTGAQPIYLSCLAEDLLLVEIEAWERGFNQADTDSNAALTDIQAIEQLAEHICDHCLEIYVPLDLARFREVFTSAWCSGYRTGLGGKEEPLTRRASQSSTGLRAPE